MKAQDGDTLIGRPVPRLLGRCVLGLVCVGVATLLTFPLRTITSHSLSLLFVLAVMLAARYGGFWPGMLAVMAATLSFDYFFDINPGSFDLVQPAEFLRVAVFTGVALLVASLTAQSRQALRAAQESGAALQKALDEIRILRGVIPICMYCKQIRTDAGSWERLEKYISEHTEAAFSHGVCPECYQKHHPEIYKQRHGG